MLTGKDLNSAIQATTSKGDTACAVAFWGAGATRMFGDAEGRSIRIICNLASGGTNPYEIEKMMKAFGEQNVRQMDNLHAKVYIGTEGSVVASANASANGLGLEGKEQQQWLEAGVKLSETTEVLTWFDGLFDSNETRPITGADLKKAKAQWKSRRRNRPGVSFLNYDIGDDHPLISWTDKPDYKTDQDGVREQLGYYNDGLESAIAEGLEILSVKDKELVEQGRWVLSFARRRDGKGMKKGQGLTLRYYNQVIDDCFQYTDSSGNPEGDHFACAVGLGNLPPQPFSVADDHLVDLFYQLISEPEFSELLSEAEDDDTWFVDREKCMRRFLVELQNRYRQSFHGY